MSFSYALADFLDYRDKEVCERVRKITREEITKHPNPEFQIQVIDTFEEFFGAFAIDIVMSMKKSLDEGRQFVGIFPVGPVPQYAIAARMINELRLPLHHVHTFNMDEYADEDGNTAPADWIGSFQKTMMANFFDRIDEDLRPPLDQIHFPTTENIDYYGELMQEAGPVDVCFGGIGWCGHIAFWESSLGHEFGDDLEAYKQAKARIVTLTPITIMQNALHSFSGDWSWVPPKAATIAPAEMLSAKRNSYWLHGSITPDFAWQRFIARLVAHGPVNTLVPGSILQEVPGTYTMIGGVADNVEINMS